MASKITPADEKAYQELLDANLAGFRRKVLECSGIYAYRLENRENINKLFFDYVNDGDARKLEKGLEEMPFKSDAAFENLQQLVVHAIDAEEGFKRCKDATTDDERKEASEALAKVGEKINITAELSTDPNVKTSLIGAVAFIAISAIICALLGGPIGALLMAGIAMFLLDPTPPLRGSTLLSERATLNSDFFKVNAPLTPMADLKEREDRKKPIASLVNQNEVNQNEQDRKENIENRAKKSN